MKRSEAIQLLKNTLDRIKGCDPDSGETLYPPDEYIIFCILKDLEQAGMSPPLVHPIHHYHLDMIQALDSEYRKWEEE